MAHSADAFDPVIDRVERWFVARGFPHAIDDYKAVTDVFTRMYPWLVFIMLVETFSIFDDRISGWLQALAMAGAITLLLIAAALVNRYRGRPPFHLPSDVGFIELAFFVCIVPLLDLIFKEDNRLSWALAVLITNLLILAFGYVVTSYGLFHMLWWGLKQMVKELTGLITLLARSLPLLLLFATFLFINAEMWQVAHDISWAFYAIVMGTISVAAIGFLAIRLPTELLSLERFSSWKEVTRVAASCYPNTKQLSFFGDKPKRVRLSRGERFNLLLLMVTAKLVQIALVGTMIGAFYVAFGLLTVRAETIVQWTQLGSVEELKDLAYAQFTLFGTEVVLTRELIQVSGFIAAISSLQFAVSLVTDDTYREEFNNDIDDEVRELMAVRTLYLSHVAGPRPDTGKSQAAS